MGVGKYLSAGSGVTYGYGSPNQECGGSAAKAWDFNSQACFAIYGLAVTINDTAAPYQAGFEVCNLNWHMMDTRAAVVAVAQLSGPLLA